MESLLDRDIINDYLECLEFLRSDDRWEITELTALAQKHMCYAAEIVEAIEQHLQRVGQDLKLPALYLIDSIIKNSNSKMYRILFTKNIIDLFFSVFEGANSTARESMFRLRKSWKESFSREVLDALDTKIHSIDKGWPIMKPTLGTFIRESPDRSFPLEFDEATGKVKLERRISRHETIVERSMKRNAEKETEVDCDLESKGTPRQDQIKRHKQKQSSEPSSEAGDDACQQVTSELNDEVEVANIEEHHLDLNCELVNDMELEHTLDQTDEFDHKMELEQVLSLDYVDKNAEEVQTLEQDDIFSQMVHSEDSLNLFLSTLSFLSATTDDAVSSILSPEKSQPSDCHTFAECEKRARLQTCL